MRFALGGRCRSAIPASLWPLFLGLVVLGATLALTYNCVLFGDRANLAGRYDVYRAAGPLAYYGDCAIHQGELPLWNPLTYCGMPYAANPIPAFFYPPNLLRSYLNFDPTPYKTQAGWVVLMALHLVLAGVGILFLARDHRLSYPASFAAAFVFVFSAIWVRRVCEYHFICMVGWLPILLLLARRALSQHSVRTKLWYALACGITFGMTVLSGSINIAPYMAVTITTYCLLFRLLHLRPEGPERAVGLVKTFGGDAGFLLVLFVVAGLTAAALLWPGSELAGFSSRAKESVYQIASPGYRGSPMDLYHTLIRYPGLKWEPENIRGAGIAALLLAFAGLSYRRWRNTLLYAALFLVLFDCSLGKPFPVATLIERINPIQMVSSTRAFDFALLPLGMLAGFGVDEITTRSGPRWWRAVRGGLLLLAGILAVRSLAPLIGPGTFVPVSKLALVVPAAALAVMLVASWVPGQTLWRVLLVALLFGETLVWNYHYVPLLVMRPNFPKWAGVYTGDEPLWSDNRRGTDKVVNRHLYALRPAINGYEPAHIDRVRQVIASDRRARVYHRLVSAEEATQDNHRGNLFMKRSFWLARQYANAPLPHKHTLFPPTTTVFLAEADALPLPRVAPGVVPRRCVSDQAEEVRFISAEHLASIQKRLALSGSKRSSTALLPTIDMPRVHSALCVKLTGTAGVTAESRFNNPDTGTWELGHTASLVVSPARPVTIELPLPDFNRLQPQITLKLRQGRGEVQLADAYLLVDRADEDALIQILARRANSVDLEVGELDGYRVLTFMDAAYPGWRAYVDSDPVPIYLANEAFKAIVVPPGTHHVRFAFSPWRPYLAILISLATLFAAAIGLALLRPHKAPAPPAPSP